MGTTGGVWSKRLVIDGAFGGGLGCVVVAVAAFIGFDGAVALCAGLTTLFLAIGGSLNLVFIAVVAGGAASESGKGRIGGALTLCFGTCCVVAEVGGLLYGVAGVCESGVTCCV